MGIVVSIDFRIKFDGAVMDELEQEREERLQLGQIVLPKLRVVTPQNSLQDRRVLLRGSTCKKRPK